MDPDTAFQVNPNPVPDPMATRLQVRVSIQASFPKHTKYNSVTLSVVDPDLLNPDPYTAFQVNPEPGFL